LNKVDLPTFGRPMMATRGAGEAVPDALVAPPGPEDDFGSFKRGPPLKRTRP